MPTNRQKSIRILAGAAMAVVLAAGSQPALGEQPTWSQVRAPLYAMRDHQFQGQSPALNAQQGIWRFELDANRWHRLMPFFYSARGFLDYLPDVAPYLTSLSDHLLIEASSYWIEIDPVSGRPVRRMARPAGDRMVVAEGPVVQEPASSRFGLTDGVYSFSGPAMHVAPFDAKEFRLFADLSGTPEAEIGPLVSTFVFDGTRGGFWFFRVAGTTVAEQSIVKVSFLPVVGGAVDLGNARRTQIPHPQGSGWVFSALFGLDSDDLLLESYAPDADVHAWVKLDPVTLQTTVLSTVQGWPDPLALTRLAKDLPTVQEQILPIVVRAPGREGTFWSSELWLFNPSGQATNVTLRRVVKPAVTKTVDLPARGSVHVDNALGWLGGGGEGDGVTHDAIVITSPYRWGEQLVAVSRVWTPSLDAGEAERGGTMGEAVPAVPGKTGYSNHVASLDQPDVFTGMNAMLVLDHREAGRFRHNLGLANDRDEAVTVNLWWGAPAYFDMPPAPVGYPRPGERQDIEVPAHGVKVVSLEKLFPASVQAGLPSQIAVTGPRPVALWFSMVDNLTGDGIHVPYSLWWMMGDADSRVATPAIAHLPGAAETKWLSDLYVTAREEEGNWWDIGPAAPIGRFYPARADRCGGAWSVDGLTSRLIGVTPSPIPPGTYGAGVIVPDVVRHFAACSQEGNVRGALELRSTSWMGGYVRTYTTRADGGTYGEMLPFYPSNGWPVQHFAGLEMGPRFRLNLGLFNGNHDHAITHRLTLYAADGTKVAEREIVLQPLASVQDRVEKMFDRPLDSFPAGTYGLTVLPLDDEATGVEGRSWAFVSMVDNVTGDPTNWW